jgi:hypothetical protein
MSHTPQTKRESNNDFQKDLQQFLKNPENKRLYDYFGYQLEISLQLLRMRKKHKLSQKALAKN